MIYTFSFRAFLALFLLLQLTTTAQIDSLVLEDKSTFTATLITNDLDKSPNLSFGGTMMGADFYRNNINVFVEGKLVYRFRGERVWLRGHYKIAHYDRAQVDLDVPVRGRGVPAEGTEPLRDVGGSVGFNFKKREVISVAREQRLKGRIALPVKSLRLYGVHAGFSDFRSVIDPPQRAYYSSEVSSTLNPTGLVTVNATAMMRMKMISFGFHRQVVSNYVIDCNDESDVFRYVSRFTRMFYADVLFGVDIRFDDLLVPFNHNAPNADPSTRHPYYNQAFNYYRVNINSSVKKMPIGCRIGWESNGLGTIGLLIGLEAGLLPGTVLRTPNTFLIIKLGTLINAKAK